ncbi:MAG: class I SAM-dependent methyltransferase [Chlamydiales bacterium]|nr:class I SAM-dependent methyltransferase [Chlamydiales bacterium]
MNTLTSQQYWNEVGSKKVFEDPLYFDKLSPFLTPASTLIEYGCGYGRLMQLVKEQGYQDVTGFDFAQNMIERGKQTFPHLNMRLLDEPGIIPKPDESADAVIMLTVLCCMADLAEQSKVIGDIWRVLKKGGILYLSDFLICDDEKYRDKYAEGLRTFGQWGVYTTSEKLVVRHMTSQSVFELLKDFDVQWFEQYDFKTMNHNPARTFHCIARKR